jgi:hypothetical protein
MSPATPILAMIALGLAGMGYLGGWTWWNIGGIVLMVFCMFGGGLGGETKTVSDTAPGQINSPEAIAAREREHQARSAEFRRRQAGEEQSRENFLNEHDIWQRSHNYLNQAINETHKKRRKGFSKDEWEVIEQAADYTARRDHEREGRRK